MTRLALVLLGTLLSGPVLADALIATRTIAARDIIGPEDLARTERAIPGAITDPAIAIGMEARVVLYAGRPIRPGDLTAPAVVDRNEIVVLVYKNGGLVIATEGRALDRGAVGDRIRAMNLSSRTTITGTIGPDGAVWVGPSDALLAHIGDG